MKQFAFFIFATLLISTAPTSGQLADPDKSAFTKMYTKGCIEMLNRDSDKIRDAYQMSAPLTKQEISNYCECGSSLVADFLSKEEYRCCTSRQQAKALARCRRKTEMRCCGKVQKTS
jgi:hypothetical protein